MSFFSSMGNFFDASRPISVSKLVTGPPSFVWHGTCYYSRSNGNRADFNRISGETVEKVNCSRCSHFFITWNAGMPYGCSAWGVKSRQYPHVAVYATSGFPCQLFAPKVRTAQGSESKK